MRFSSSLKFNAVSEWWDEYIDYDSLKKTIYQLEKRQQDVNTDVPYTDLEANEHTALVNDVDHTSTDAAFLPLLDRELHKITAFYETQEKDLIDELEVLEEMIRHQDEVGLADDPYDAMDTDEDSEVEESPSRSRDAYRRRRRVSSTASHARVPPNLGASATIPEEPESSAQEHDHRFSISSASSGEYGGLDESLASLGGVPKTTLGKLANKMHFMKDSITSSNDGVSTVWTSRSNYAYDTRLLFKRRITTLYISFTSLRSYTEINYSGFRKIVKKYDKVTYSSLKERYLHSVVENAYPFTQLSKDRVNDGIRRLVDAYAKCVCKGDHTAAKSQLKLYQRENIAVERDTVWRQMIGRARTEDAGDGMISVVKEEAPAIIAIPRIGVRITRTVLYVLLSLTVFIVMLLAPVISGAGEASRCLAILVFATILWATEAIPLFVTSLMIPLLLVLLQVIRIPTEDPDVFIHLDPKGATQYIFSVMFSPTIMLLIGGFTISTALSKTEIDRLIITRVLALAGTKPNTVLLAFMGVSCFASMWISNVAAPTLCFTLVKPILRTLPPKASFGPALILGIALAANIGGQSSPISSPQNLIALQEIALQGMELSWGSWFAVAIPVSIVSIVLIWGLLLASYRPSLSPGGEGTITIKPIKVVSRGEGFSTKQWFVTVVCVITIALWCVEHQLEWLVGDMGVVALVPIVVFFATGVLGKTDFEQFAWTIVFLAMGGIALGKGVTSSGLLDVLDEEIRGAVGGLELYKAVIILSPIVLVISTFISHTIASVLLVPIASQVAANIGTGEHKTLLIFITALICSTGMGMPVSGFPNQTAATQENDLGELYLSNVDFLKNGVPASIIATLVVSTVGYLLMRAIGL